jgi:hypothetical protein
MRHHFVPKDWIFLILFYFFKWSQLLIKKIIFDNAKAPHCSFHWDLKDLRINWLKQDLIPKTKACCKGCNWNVNLQNGNAFGSYENSSLTLSHTYHSPWKCVWTMPCLDLFFNSSLLFCFRLNCKLKVKLTTLSLIRKRGQCSQWHLNFLYNIIWKIISFQVKFFLTLFKSICNCFIHGYHSPTNNITLGPPMLTCSKTIITIYLILHILRWKFNLMLNFIFRIYL